MSSGGSVEAPAQPREWFTVLFGNRLFHRQERYFVSRFTDAVKSICLEEGLLLTDTAFGSPIIEDDNVDYLVADIRDSIERVHMKHTEGLHMPLVFVIDDQTLLDLHEDYIEPNFSNDAFIYSLKAARVQEFIGVNSWDQVRADVRELQPMMQEYNPLGPLPAPPTRRVEALLLNKEPTRSRSDPPRPGTQQNRRDVVDVYRGAVAPPPAPRQNPVPRGKAPITMALVGLALDSVRDHPALLNGLAEDMDESIDFANLRELPWHPEDLLDLLKLFVLSTESPVQNQREMAAGRQLRKKMTETMLKSRLLKAVCDAFVGGLHDRVAKDEISEGGILEAAEAIMLLLRAFIQLGKHNFFDDDALELWGELEAPVFGLPARFWRALPRDVADGLCSAAASVTTQDPSIYKDSVRACLDNERRSAERAPTNRRPEERNGRSGRNPGAAGSSSAYNYDFSDESDTSEVYGTGAPDGIGAGAESSNYEDYDTPTEGDLIEEEPARGRPRRDEEYDGRRNRGGPSTSRQEEELLRREQERHERRAREAEEERRRMEQEQREAEQRRREAEEAAAREREYERRRQEHLALQQQERLRWEQSNDTGIAWHDNDGTEPEVSYRKLATQPVYSDLYRPKVPYMRKALVSGAYSDNEHYLDVQFRLMREDMVAPLRDGIYSQKMLTPPGQLIASSNELKIYPTIEVGALQVRSIDGLPMRVVNIPQHMLFQIREERQLKFGGCVVISSDKFCREFHIGWICDRFQEPGMPWQGRLAISFFDECPPVNTAARPIDKKATYALAESPAYLEAYRHVLRVLKKMKKNVIFPLERYLVHMKKNTRLPQYMRTKLNVEDAEEDRERMVLYSKKIAEEHMKEREAAKKKEDRRSRSTTRSPQEDEEMEEEHVTTEEGASEENLADDGFNTDEEDSFLTGGRHAHPNPKDLELISIRGKAYHVDKLEEEFQTDVLDETQRKAMCYALTSELAIIQGPPGTGKTHIGVEMVMAILENRSKWRMTEPILIVTFSNQALDHFLDKIRLMIVERGLEQPDTPSVVRLGSRSEHDGIKLNCLLADVMKTYEEDLAGEAANEKNKARRHKQAWLAKLMQAVKTVQLSRKSILQYTTLRQIIDPTHEMQLRQAAYGMRDTSGNPLNMDETLVSWLLNKSYEKKRDLPPGSDSEEEEEETQWGGGGAVMRAARKKPAEKKREGGRETKKEKNERKRQEKRGGQWRDGQDSSDTEESEDEIPSDVLDLNDDDDEEDEDREMKEQLRKINERASRQQSSAASEEKWLSEKYEMNADWECEREFAARNGGRVLCDDVEIFSRVTKPGLIRGTGRGGKDNKSVNVDPNIVRDIHEHKQYILSKEAFTVEEARAVRDVRTLTKEQRWKLLCHWQNQLASFFRNSLDEYVVQYVKACAQAEAASDIARAAVLRKALVIGATTTGSAKRRALVARIAPKVLLVEEAAEVLEAHLLASIVPSVQHAIFIGDHQQLRPSTAVHALAKAANMEVSLFERLVKNGYPFHTLGLQHRMLAPLTQHVVKPFFYNMLQDAPSIHGYPSVLGMGSNLFFWAHQAAEDTVLDSMSKKNIVEAEMCRNLANYILMQGQYKAHEITIIGMYGAQVQEIKRSLVGVPGAVGDVAVETVDSFQGKENRVMILSLVRSRSGGVGFLAIANRITVALTRAQHGMYVVGNFKDIAHYSELWDKIVYSLGDAGHIHYDLPVVCQRHNNHTPIREKHHFIERTPYGGCDQRCGYTMACGHDCKQVCHPPYQHQRWDPDGPNLECKETCTKQCQKCGAQCTKKCQEPCGTCHAIVTLDLPCGHTVRCECGARNLARCKEPCAEVLDCGHNCQNKCSVECVNVKKCEKGVSYTHPLCRHPLILPCNIVRPFRLGETMTTPACYEKCPERLVCGHKCPRNCGESCPTMCEQIVHFEGACGHKLQKKCSDDSRHVKCTALVDSDMPHCTHRIKMECYQSRNQNECRSACKKATSCGHECALSCGECYKRASAHECSARCTRDLPCGHKCQGGCGKPCVCLASCRVRCSHQRCGPPSRDKGGNLAYGRACSQPCVLCVQPCDNHCEHRACQKKCFEECNVNPCNKPCVKMLKCGHGCLGLCGEPCPSLCGTCSNIGYKKLIENYPDEDRETRDPVPRLIRMPDCEHIFPYKYVDKRVKEQTDAGCIVLKCPRCNGQIEDCKRYYKQTKRLWAEADSRKWAKRMTDLEMSRAELNGKYIEMRKQLTAQQSEVVKWQQIKCKNGAARGQRIALDTFFELENLYARIEATLRSADSRDEFFYWQSVLSCHKSVCGLVIEYLTKINDFSVDMVLDAQPQLRMVLEEAFERRRNRLFPMRDQFRSMCDVVVQSLEHRRVGHLVPQFRTAMIKSHLFYHMEHLNATLRDQRSSQNGELVDLTVLQANAYKRVIRSILKDSPADHPQKKLEDMMQKIFTDVYGNLPTMAAPLRVFKVELPDF